MVEIMCLLTPRYGDYNSLMFWREKLKGQVVLKTSTLSEHGAHSDELLKSLIYAANAASEVEGVKTVWLVFDRVNAVEGYKETINYFKDKPNKRVFFINIANEFKWGEIIRDIMFAGEFNMKQEELNLIRQEWEELKKWQPRE